MRSSFCSVNRLSSTNGNICHHTYHGPKPHDFRLHCRGDATVPLSTARLSSTNGHPCHHAHRGFNMLLSGCNASNSLLTPGYKQKLNKNVHYNAVLTKACMAVRQLAQSNQQSIEVWGKIKQSSVLANSFQHPGPVHLWQHEPPHVGSLGKVALSTTCVESYYLWHVIHYCTHGTIAVFPECGTCSREHL